MMLVKMPSLVTGLFPNWLWHKPRQERVLYLTFDDGPSPGVTEQVLETLAVFHAKATFFVIGDKVRRHPDTLLAVKAAGHSIGNHTFNHLNLWKTPLRTYLENTSLCQVALQEALGEEVGLFRPPYGKMTPRAARHLLPTHEIVMWDVIAGDFHAGYARERVLRNVIRHARAGSIVVFHDSEKCKEKMRYALPRVLEHFSGQGYQFARL